MKWSGPLPKLVYSVHHDQTCSAWGFYLARYGLRRQHLNLIVYLGHRTHLFYLVAPKRSTP